MKDIVNCEVMSFNLDRVYAFEDISNLKYVFPLDTGGCDISE